MLHMGHPPIPCTIIRGKSLTQKELIKRFVARYNETQGGHYAITRYPDEENRQTRDIDAFAEEQRKPALAVEHTRVQTFANEKLDSSRFMRICGHTRESIKSSNPFLSAKEPLLVDCVQSVSKGLWGSWGTNLGGTAWALPIIIDFWRCRPDGLPLLLLHEPLLFRFRVHLLDLLAIAFLDRVPTHFHAARQGPMFCRELFRNHQHPF